MLVHEDNSLIKNFKWDWKLKTESYSPVLYFYVMALFLFRDKLTITQYNLNGLFVFIRLFITKKYLFHMCMSYASKIWIINIRKALYNTEHIYHFLLQISNNE